MTWHRNQGVDDAHSIHSWVYDDLTKRDAHQPSEGPTDPITAEDAELRRVCFVKSTRGFYALTNFSPIEWTPLTPLAGVLPDNFSRGEQLYYTDPVNKVIGPLGSEPVIDEVAVSVIKGVDQEYGKDYTVRQVQGGTAPGFYICISPTSTAPGGGTFVAGTSNPTVGIDTLLSSVEDDKVQVIYPTYPV